MELNFKEEYQKLNKEQKNAVESIDGPLMVVAGPGTGKTQILALRIANILEKTDTKSDSILCLTFTNSGVEAMQARLIKYIGQEGKKVNVFTFHSFGMQIIEEYYSVLGLQQVPKLLDETDTTIIFDEILNRESWQYLRPRSDQSRYFSDLKSLISILKRERITPDKFLLAVEKEIQSLESDPENISSRGESKGDLKKEVLSKLEGLERSKEVAKFFDIYEQEKKGKNAFDYDDVLERLVKIVEISKDAKADIQERYLYVLIDEHQDSSRVQNEFLARVWGKVEKPNIMVVGDDRQLIYGFSGASISHFQGFQKTFKGAKLVTLVENYRSTQVILDASHALLQSVMTKEKLVSQSGEHHPIKIVAAETATDEILAAAADIKDKINPPAGGGVRIGDCAILVPKNKDVREALAILHSQGLAVSSMEALNLFDQENAQAFIRVLKIIESGDIPSLALSFFDKLSGLNPIEAHIFLVGQNMRNFSWSSITNTTTPSLFGENDKAQNWINKLSTWKESGKNLKLKELIEHVGQELLADSVENQSELVSNQEILNTVLGLAEKELEKNSRLTLVDFLAMIDRLESYGEHLPVLMEPKDGVKVLTLHSSKGLEFEYVWIAHMDEHSLNSSKRMGIALPKEIAEQIEDGDIDKIKRKLYVAITRARRFCTLSYAKYSNAGREQEVARIIADLPEEVFEKVNFKNKEEKSKTKKNNDLTQFLKLVKEKYKDRYVSVSLLNNFFECPWKWYFRNLLGLPEKKSESLEFGSAVHQAIDQILRLKKIVLPARPLARPEDKEVARVVEAWALRRLGDIVETRENEKSISSKDERFPHLNIYGKIDLVEYLSPKELRVTDFKTGSVRKKSDIEKLDEEGRMTGNLRQLAMYSYLLQNNPNLNVRESRLEFLEAKNIKPARPNGRSGGDSIYDTVITQKEIDLLIKDIKDYDQLVKSGEWVDRECHYNSYGKNTECEYCALAEIYK